VVEQLMSQIKNKSLSHAYIFYGEKGCGKTSTSRVLAKTINCTDKKEEARPCCVCKTCLQIENGYCVDVIEIDAASNRGINDVRELREKVIYTPTFGKTRVIILDEAHMLTREAFNALLKTLEEPISNTIFILVTTDFRKIPATIVSRCQKLIFRRFNIVELGQFLLELSKKHNINMSRNAALMICKLAKGSLRDIINIFDQLLSLSSSTIEESDIIKLFGVTDSDLLFECFSYMSKKDVSSILKFSDKLGKLGINYTSFTEDLIEFVRDVLVFNNVDSPDKILTTIYSEDTLKIGKSVDYRILTQWLESFMDSMEYNNYNIDPRFIFETTLVGLCE